MAPNEERGFSVALSGGVDSTAAAISLVRGGFDVLAMTFITSDEPHSTRAAESANIIARALGVEHEVLDVSEMFERLIIDPFVDSYLSGLTPNPCIWCNREVKFGLLLDEARARGRTLATGHYAGLDAGEDGAVKLRRGTDRSKDQSYVLWTLDQAALSGVVFPLGGVTRDESLRLVGEEGLGDAVAPESQDICFLSGGRYGDFIRERAGGGLTPGPIVDPEGNVLGEHEGLAFYTVGQRRGLGLGGSDPLYVLELRVESNCVVVGDGSLLGCAEFRVEDLNFISGRAPDGRLQVEVITRYRGPANEAELEVMDNHAGTVRYAKPGPPAVPGQSAAFYRGDELIGGGFISRD